MKRMWLEKLVAILLSAILNDFHIYAILSANYSDRACNIFYELGD